MSESKEITLNTIFRILLDYSSQYKVKIGNKKLSQSQVALLLSVDKSTVSKWKSGTAPIHPEIFDKVLEIYENRVTLNHEEFFLFLADELAISGYDRTRCLKILENTVSIRSGIRKLLNQYSHSVQHLQEELSRTAIISNLKSHFHQHHDFINIADNHLLPDDKYEDWIHGKHADNDKELLVKQNYLILKFLSYRVMIVLSNKAAEMAEDPLIESVKRLEKLNGIQMVIVFTDHQVRIDRQRSCITNCNLFFETITPYDLTKVTIYGYKIHELDLKKGYRDAQLYAQVIFDRFNAYLNVIRNELIFLNYDRKKNGTPVNSDDIYNLSEFANRILLKDIFDYPNTTKQSIFFERNCLMRLVKKMKQRSGKDKLGCVVEICYPNSFLSCQIERDCEDLYLFTSSRSFYNYIEKELDKMDSRIIHPDLHHELVSPAPQYINSRHPDLLGKVDLVILGLGSASSISNLTEYMRYINSWLSPDGAVLISFVNSDSVLLENHYGANEYWQSRPVEYGAYWRTHSSEKVNFIKYLKPYTIEEARKALDPYVSSIDYNTYPFLSALLDSRLYSDGLIKEVRRIDEETALNSGHKSRFGHYITVTGHRDASEAGKSKSKDLHTNIINYLESEKIHYRIIPHDANIDESGWRKLLLETGEDYSQFDIVKTIILQTRGLSSPELHYCILKGNERIKFGADYSLLSEKKVIENYGKGCISPLVVLPQNQELTGYTGDVYFMNPDDLKKEFVILSAGISTKSIKLTTTDFRQIMTEMNAICLSANEL